MTKSVPYRPSSAAGASSVESRAMESQETCLSNTSPSPSSFDPSAYAHPFISFMSDNPTVYHAIGYFSKRLMDAGFERLSEREAWTPKLRLGGKYFFQRNDSGLIAFIVGERFSSGNGCAVIAAHCDALAAKVKPVSVKPRSHGYLQLGISQYAGALSQSWLDRDLGVGGRVFVKNASTGKIEVKLVKLDHPIARIPSIAPHFGLKPEGQLNRETRMVPIIGLDNSDLDITGMEHSGMKTNDSGLEDKHDVTTFSKSQPPRLVKVIAKELGVGVEQIVNWDLELFDFQPAQLGGLDKEFIFAGRVDDKLCCYAAVEALLYDASSTVASSSDSSSGLIKMVGLFDDEEIGSLMRQGAKSNFLISAIERISEAFSGGKHSRDALYQTYANSFMLSSDVTHAYNPNYDDVYLKGATPRLNVGVSVYFDSNGNMTTDGASSAMLHRIASKSGSLLQTFQVRNDSRSGGTVGPMLSAATGIRAIDAGIPQLSMHSIRATTGSLDPGLGVKLFSGFFRHFEETDKEFVE